jgi:hypothetical protein
MCQVMALGRLIYFPAGVVVVVVLADGDEALGEVGVAFAE